MTDVNVAVELLTDAFKDQFDVALLLSADSDLVGPVETVRRLFSAKQVIVVFPARTVFVCTADKLPTPPCTSAIMNYPKACFPPRSPNPRAWFCAARLNGGDPSRAPFQLPRSVNCTGAYMLQNESPSGLGWGWDDGRH